MAYEHKPDSGSMFKNEDKTTPHQPDFRGKYKTADGELRRVAGWEHITKSGTHYIALSFDDIPANQGDA